MTPISQRKLSSGSSVESMISDTDESPFSPKNINQAQVVSRTSPFELIEKRDVYQETDADISVCEEFLTREDVLTTRLSTPQPANPGLMMRIAQSVTSINQLTESELRLSHAQSKAHKAEQGHLDAVKKQTWLQKQNNLLENELLKAQKIIDKERKAFRIIELNFIEANQTAKLKQSALE